RGRQRGSVCRELAHGRDGRRRIGWSRLRLMPVAWTVATSDREISGK
ncbi:hypothetical protein GBAR_LOCUS11829, partial [Geodia barretti]